MARLLERTVDAASERLVLLAPAVVSGDVFHHVEVDVDRHRQLVSELQRLRGRVYLADGAITPEQLTTDGRHCTEEDERAWHILCLDQAGSVSGCGWLLEHPATVSVRQLRVRKCPLASAVDWRPRLWAAVNAELQRARRENLLYAELGGWAISEDHRASVECLLLALAGYSLGRLRGGGLGMTMATVRHGSATILRRMGGEPLEANGVPLPSYYDPRYGCEMQILRFDSRRPSETYASLVDRLCDRMTNVEVVARVERPMPGVAINAPMWSPAAGHPRSSVILAS